MNIKDILKEKKFIVGTHLIKQSFNIKLTLEEFLLLVYFPEFATALSRMLYGIED